MQLHLLLYYITDRTQFSGDEPERQERLLERIAQAARCGINFVQLRENDLHTRDLESLAREAVKAVRSSGGETRLLINSRNDVALAVGADGVHLRSKDISPEEVRRIWRSAGTTQEPIIAVSCHSQQEVLAAEYAGADFAVFGPIFEKQGATQASAGLVALAAACQGDIPVLALGGVTPENAEACLRAGAKGIAGIRLFQQGNLEERIDRLRTVGSSPC